MSEKCTKYEALFTFGDEEKLLEHIKVCPDCKLEHEKMQAVTNLIKEAAPVYREERKNRAKLKAVCAISLMLLSGVTLGVINLNTDISDTIRYGHVLSAEDLGLPVDSYGFLAVD